IHTNHHFHLQTEVESLQSILNAINYNRELKYFNLIFVGALSMFALFFFCQYLQQRSEHTFLIYVCYVTCTVLHALREFVRFQGLPGLHATFTNWYYFSEIPLAYSIYTLYTLFFIFLLDLKRLNGFAFKYARFVVVLFMLNLLLDIYLKIFHSIHLSYTFFYFLRTPLLILTLPILIFSYKSRSTSAKYFFYGSLALLIGVLFNLAMSTLQRFGQFEYLFNTSKESIFWKSYIVYSRIGMLIEVVFFSLGLAHKSKLEYSTASNDALKSNFASMINHSVSNALNKLKGMIKRKEEGVIPFIDETGAMMQNMLSVVRNQISLSQELILAQQFFDFRNENSQAINFKINRSNCNTDNYFVPPMLLQPFIENCVEHAWSEDDIEKKIQINIVVQNKFIAIEIIDNGNGIVENNLKEKSHGMFLIAERINYFNTIFGCNISCQIKNNSSTKGTTVTIKNIPLKK
ncbi:MAG TPA: 7TM diverse intracellular signaling domain-containing protein, partial [Bacteroidia bacterium]|nr:7TM diverse intracellular signaling domain-containing protein [Bacteroidia bacterium]